VVNIIFYQKSAFPSSCFVLGRKLGRKVGQHPHASVYSIAREEWEEDPLERKLGTGQLPEAREGFTVTILQVRMGCVVQL
jgi:hypothetical protein